MKKRWFFAFAMVMPAALVLMVMLGAQASFNGNSGATPASLSSPGLGPDLHIASHTDDPDPVVGTNTVQYQIVVENQGGDPAPDVMVDIYQTGPSTDFGGSLTIPTSGSFSAASVPDEGQITSVHGSGWVCGVYEGGDWYCDMGALAAGATAPTIFVNVLAPDFPTTIYNNAYVSTTATEFDPYNNYSQEGTDVVIDTDCDPGVMSCGDGHVDFGIPSSVTTLAGGGVNSTKWFGGTMFFPAVAGATGGEDWAMFAPSVPTAKCLLKLLGLKCTFQMNTQAINSVYTGNNVTFVGFCHRSHCPALVPGLVGLLFVSYFDAANHQHILPHCIAGGPVKCFQAKRTAAGDLKITVRNIGPGDPRIAGVCVSKC